MHESHCEGQIKSTLTVDSECVCVLGEIGTGGVRRGEDGGREYWERQLEWGTSLEKSN